MTDSTTPAKRPPRELESLILHIVKKWIDGKLESKYQLRLDSVTDANRRDFEEKKSKIATEAFLAARSRPGREFARWFTATLCSVNQRLTDDEFVALSKALETRADQVRSLTLLALSARG